MKASDMADLEEIAATIEKNPDVPSGWLVDRMPIGRRRVLNLVRKHEGWLSTRLGCEVVYSPACYAASGNGPFGRGGSARGKAHAATFYVRRRVAS